MKKLTVVAIAAVLALALAGCASGGASSSASASSSESALASSASSEPTAGMPNPWSDVATAEEAGQGAGFETGFTAGDDLKIGELNWREITYSYMTGIAQARYDGGAVEVTVRKGQGISGQEFTGDYNEYKYTWTSTLDGVEFACSGNEEGAANLVEWSVDGYSYAAYCIGLGGENYGIKEADLPNLLASIS